MWQAVAGGVAIQVLSGFLGYLVEHGKEKEAQAILEKAKANYENLTPADLQDIALEVLGPTELSKITTDPAYRIAQNEALASFDQIMEGGGRTLADDANLARLENRTSKNAARQTNSIIESMTARGVGGSGAELALRQQAGQDAIERQSNADMDTAARAEQRYFQAIREKGDMAGRLRSQDYGEKSNAARAQDLINQFNVTNKQNVGRMNNDVAQQRYNNKLGIQDRITNLDRERANAKRNDGQRMGGVISGVGNAAGGGLGSYSAIGNGAGGANLTGTYKPTPNFDTPKQMDETNQGDYTYPSWLTGEDEDEEYPS